MRGYIWTLEQALDKEAEKLERNGNWTRIQNHLVCKPPLDHLAKMA